jgi:hypothetical protein
MDENNDSSDSYVEFKDQFKMPSYTHQQKGGFLVDLLLKYSKGYIKNEKQANQILIAAIIVMVVVSIILLSSALSGPTAVPPVSST